MKKERVVYWLGFLLAVFLIWDIGKLFLFAIQNHGYTMYVGDELWILNIELFAYVPLSLYFVTRTGYDQVFGRKKK